MPKTERMPPIVKANIFIHQGDGSEFVAIRAQEKK
jgi:hypothetical protein